MALPLGLQLRYWALAAAVFLAMLWLLGDVLAPFVLGAAIAYLLDPVADRLERLGLSRVLAVVTIAVAMTLTLAVATLLVVPALIEQTAALINAAPGLFQSLRDTLLARFPDIADAESTMRQSLDSIGAAIQSRGMELLNAVLSSLAGVFSVALLVVVTPVVAFYLLLDWDKMVGRIDALLPRDHAPTIRRLAREIDAVLSGFIRGQLTVCLILATWYGVALMLTGLQYGLVVGVAAGVLSFIPYVGAILGGVAAIGLALWQFWDAPVLIGVVVAIFVAGQVVEGNFLVPKLVGGSVGLHPVWLLLALSAFGALFGFVGMLVAVPISAAIGVLARFGTEVYRDSPLYDSGRARQIARPGVPPTPPENP